MLILGITKGLGVFSNLYYGSKGIAQSVRSLIFVLALLSVKKTFPVILISPLVSVASIERGLDCSFLSSDNFVASAVLLNGFFNVPSG
jgi:hypothetical protein